MVSLLLLQGPTPTQPQLLAAVDGSSVSSKKAAVCVCCVSVISAFPVKGPLPITSVRVRLDLALDPAKTHSSVLCRKSFLLLFPY